MRRGDDREASGGHAGVPVKSELAIVTEPPRTVRTSAPPPYRTPLTSGLRPSRKQMSW